MSEEFGKKHMAAVIAKARDRLDSALEQFPETMGQIPFGMKRPTRTDVVGMFDAMTQIYPPVPMILPDGTEIVESPWVLALEVAEVSGGPEFLRDYRRAMRALPLEELLDD